MKTKFNLFDFSDDEFCYDNCASCIHLIRGNSCSGYCIDCIYWDSYKRDWNTNRRYCHYYDAYCFPNERRYCLSKET